LILLFVSTFNKTDELILNNTIIPLGYNIMLGIMPMIYGPLSDRYGRRVPMISCLLVYLGACLMAAGAWNVIALIFCCIIQGIGVSGNI
jgi:MFS family permease